MGIQDLWIWGRNFQWYLTHGVASLRSISYDDREWNMSNGKKCRFWLDQCLGMHKLKDML